MKSLFRLFLFLSLIFSACKGVDDITFTGVDNVVLKGMENNKVNFKADIGVHNPSSVSFRITEVNLKATVDGNFIGTLTTGSPVKVKARTDSSYTTDFSLEMANLLTGASTLYTLSRKKQVNVEMAGYIKARSWLKTKKVDIIEKRLIDVPSMR